MDFFFYFLTNFFFLPCLQCCIGFWHTTMQISHNYTHIPSLPSLPSLATYQPSRSSQSIRLVSLCYTANSHQLSTLQLMRLFSNLSSAIHLTTDAAFLQPLISYPPYNWCDFSPTSHQLSILQLMWLFSTCPSLFLPFCVLKSILYIWVSIPSLQIGSSV